MSLVGTRPPTVDEWEQYELHHRSRMSTKPGITGMWQVSGRSDITDFEEVVRLDTESGSFLCAWRGKSNITKSSYYWRLRKVREAYLETAEQTQTFVEVPSPAIHPVNMTSSFFYNSRSNWKP